MTKELLAGFITIKYGSIENYSWRPSGQGEAILITTQLDTVVNAYVSRIEINCICGMLEIIQNKGELP